VSREAVAECEGKGRGARDEGQGARAAGRTYQRVWVLSHLC
jgi:hypothetical protein